jgi:hypothetical protein
MFISHIKSNAVIYKTKTLRYKPASFLAAMLCLTTKQVWDFLSQILLPVHPVFFFFFFFLIAAVHLTSCPDGSFSAPPRLSPNIPSPLTKSISNCVFHLHILFFIQGFCWDFEKTEFVRGQCQSHANPNLKGDSRLCPAARSKPDLDGPSSN